MGTRRPILQTYYVFPYCIGAVPPSALPSAPPPRADLQERTPAPTGIPARQASSSATCLALGDPLAAGCTAVLLAHPLRQPTSAPGVDERAQHETTECLRQQSETGTRRPTRLSLDRRCALEQSRSRFAVGQGDFLADPGPDSHTAVSHGEPIFAWG
eukprot:SAG31_NODE_4070_length_3601_cov_2.171023_4_plen_157_part_00